jgi:hypothetical protein
MQLLRDGAIDARRHGKPLQVSARIAARRSSAVPHAHGKRTIAVVVSLGVNDALLSCGYFDKACQSTRYAQATAHANAAGNGVIARSVELALGLSRPQRPWH